MEVLGRINNRFASLSKSERLVAEFVQAYPDEIVSLSLQALAERCEVSDATVLRFCRSLGYSGFQDLKSTFIPELLKRGVSPHPEMRGDDSAGSYLSVLWEDANRTVRQISSQSLNTIAASLVSSRRTILIGLAGSAGVARIFGDSLSSTGLISIHLSDRVEIERMCESVGSKDVVFGISHSGETPEVCMGLERSRARGAVTVGMTNNAPSSLERTAEHVLLTSVAESLLGSYSCHPRVIELVILEMLVTRVAEHLRTE